jgi:two-component system, cell cycle sensor histidine kinase and response regulator CckA
VFLPASSKARRPAELGRPKDIPGGDETILVVEDEQPLRELVQEVLQKKGYHILEAGTGAEALTVWRCHRDRIQLLLTDIMMPEGISGRELADKLLSDRPELKVIYTSGYSLEVVNSGCAWKEGLNFLQKPYHPETLAQMVRECLDR